MRKGMEDNLFFFYSAFVVVVVVLPYFAILNFKQNVH